MGFKIGEKYIENYGKPYFIADIGANHDGSLDRALKLIELVAESGGDAAKFQNFKARTIVSKQGFENMEKLSHQSDWKKSVYDVYSDASISEDWTPILKKKCESVGIEYLTSAYDFDSVDHVESYVNVYKVGSGDITWTQILEHIAKKNKPVLLATGASSIDDVTRAFNSIAKYNSDICIMQCNTNYTASEENFKYINLRVLENYKFKFPKAVLGLSDHTFGHSTVLGAIALGASIIEKHFTDDNRRIGPDHKFAMNPATWKEMVKEANRLHLALGNSQKRIEMNEKESVIVQRRALYTTRRLEVGHVITFDDLTPLRPCKKFGIEPYNVTKIVGKKVKVAIESDEMIQWEYIDD